MKKSSRRKFLWSALGTSLAAGTLAWFQKSNLLRWAVQQNRNDSLALAAAPKIGEDLCVLTSRQVEGPFFISAPNRSNIKEDRTGKDLNLKLQIVRMPDCIPVEGAIVEIWHCDANGIYSGYPDEIAHDLWKSLSVIGLSGDNVAPLNESRFLRGAQVTDAHGIVEFQTIFPGWYEPRSPHIHFKIVAGDTEFLTSQFYFDSAFCNQMYLHQAPYMTHGASPYTPENDVAMKEHQEALGLLLTPEWSATAPITASAKIGIQFTS